MRPADLKLPNTHRVCRDLAGGRAAIYWYRRRGGPLLMKFSGDTRGEALRAEKAGYDGIVAAYAAFDDGLRSPDPRTIKDIVTLFKSAPDGLLRMRAGTTQPEWRRWLDKISSEFGDLRIEALKAKGMKREIILWRDKWASNPRTADYGIQVLKRLLSWALQQGLVDHNPASGVSALYVRNRADVIVEPDELLAILSHTSPAAGLAFRLAAATGMRRGDLVDLKWTEVAAHSIERSANKSAKGRRLAVPLTSEANAVLAELREIRSQANVPSTYVLTSRVGNWTPDGLTSNWVKAAKLAGVDKNLNDLRGTAATRFAMVPLTDEEVADIMGWEPTRVRTIRKRYVDRERIALGIAARIERHEAMQADASEAA